jgi:mitochondrial fission protein ELM1
LHSPGKEALVAPGIGPAKDRQREERNSARSGHGPHFAAERSIASPPAALRAGRDQRSWGLSIGVAGMLSQMKGLAQAVGCEFEPRRTRLRRFWCWMPLSIVPRSFAVIRDAEQFTAEEPPRLVIACGRHAVIPAICLKRQWGVRIVTVFVQDPLVDTRNFDFVVAPEHDEVRGPNVISTRGALHHVNSAVLSAARQTRMAQCFLQTGRPIATVLLGGPNRYYAFSQTDVSRLIDKLHIAARDDVQLLVVPSRRTPAEVCLRFQSEFGRDHLVWDGQDDNPYLAALAVADYVVVTGDSVSMTTEASATGKPVFVEYLRERLPARRFRKFHFSFRHAGITRPFEGRLHRWTYTPPDDTAEVARRIKERMGVPCPS